VTTGDQTDLRRASLRLALRFGTLILIIFAVLLSVTYLIVQSSQRDETTHILMDAAQAASVQSAPRDVLVARDDHGQMTVSPGAPSWFPDPSQLAAAATRDDPLQTTRTVGDKTYTIVTISHDGMSVQTAQDDAENQDELRRLALALIISGILGSIAAGLVSAIIARRALRPMVDALSLQRRFVTDASHELRTPLTLLTTRAQLLRRDAAKSPAKAETALAAGLDEILQDSRVLTGILEDLLIAADPRETAERVPLDLTQLARDVVMSLSVHAKDRHIALHGPANDEPITVVGSRASILRLFTSLVSNALDHARSEVRVEVHSVGRSAEITVRDDGRGFPDDMRERAFERFASSRAGHDDNAQTRHYGLGLALVAEIAFRHDGSVRVEPTEPGSGAVIVVTLPLSILK
jgi:two-component system OmpR family sensor kinase